MNKSPKKFYKKFYKKSYKKSYNKSYKKFYGGYTKKQTKAILSRKNAISRKAAELTNTQNLKCPAGKIKKRAYITKKGSIVGAKCVKNEGKLGKSPRNIILEKGVFKKFGYEDIINLSKSEREKALGKAVKQYGFREVILRLNALANLNIRTNKKFSSIVRSDQKMVSNWYKKYKKI